jgi:DNA-binding NtrC family response regulator
VTLPTQTCRDISVVVVVHHPHYRTALLDLLGDDGHPARGYPAADTAGLAGLGERTVLVIEYELRGDTDGLALADTVHRRCPTMPIVLLAGDVTTDLRAQCQARPLVRLVQNPVGYDDLHRLIHELAAHPKAAGRSIATTPPASTRSRHPELR